MPIKRCGTCRHWSRQGYDHVGACGLVNPANATPPLLTTEPVSGTRSGSWVNPANVASPLLTTDMTVCSKWDWRQEEAQARTVPDEAA